MEAGLLLKDTVTDSVSDRRRPVMRVPLELFSLLLLLMLAACGQNPFLGPPGPQGPQGPAGPEGQRGQSGTVIRSVEGDCSGSSCVIACQENERILSVYAINPGGTFTYEANNRAIFRPSRPDAPVKVTLTCIPKWANGRSYAHPLPHPENHQTIPAKKAVQKKFSTKMEPVDFRRINLFLSHLRHGVGQSHARFC